MLISHTFDLALAVRARRRQLKLRQLEVAVAARVGREWLVALEHGKPTVELGLVLRTLDTLGLEIHIRDGKAPPAWSVPLTAAATERAAHLGEYRPPGRPAKKERPAPPAPKAYRWEE